MKMVIECGRAAAPAPRLTMLSLPAWVRTRFDQFGKQMVRSAVAARGSVETDAEVPADTRRIDLWFMSAPACEPVPGYLGLLGRITAGPSTLEFFHNTPPGDDRNAPRDRRGWAGTSR
jgi:hypothetical protein